MLWAIQILVGKLTGASTLLTSTNSAKVRPFGFEYTLALSLATLSCHDGRKRCSRAPARSTAALPAAVCTKRTVGWKRQHTSHVAGNHAQTSITAYVEKVRPHLLGLTS